MRVELGYIPNDECQKRTGFVHDEFFSFGTSLRDSMMCALDRGKDGCQGKACCMHVCECFP